MKRTIVILGAAGSLLLAFSAASEDAVVGAQEARPDPVSIMKHGILQQVDFHDLKREHPAASSGGLDPASLRADAIVGWYDSGHNYHAEKMSGRTPGNEVMDPANRKGKGLRGGELERKGKDPSVQGVDRKGKDPKAEGVDRKGKDPKAEGVDRKGKDSKAEGIERKGKDSKAEGIERKGEDSKAQGIQRKGDDSKARTIDRKGKDPKAGALKEKATGVQELEQ